MPTAQIGFPKLQSSGNLLNTKRRQSNGEVDGNETKPKRGRPRKVKREEKYSVLGIKMLEVMRNKIEMRSDLSIFIFCKKV